MTMAGKRLRTLLTFVSMTSFCPFQMCAVVLIQLIQLLFSCRKYQDYLFFPVNSPTINSGLSISNRPKNKKPRLAASVGNPGPKVYRSNDFQTLFHAHLLGRYALRLINGVDLDLERVTVVGSVGSAAEFLLIQFHQVDQVLDLIIPVAGEEERMAGLRLEEYAGLTQVCLRDVAS